MANNGWYQLESNKTGREPSQNVKNKGTSSNRPIQGKPMRPADVPRIEKTPPRAPSPGVPRSSMPRPQSPPPPPKHSEKVLHSQTVDARGPVLLQDTVLHETLGEFVHSQGINRVVHTKGFGAFGTFHTQQSMREHTTATIFQTAGTQTPVLSRFSLAVSNKGTPDSGRNVRGFSTKFYTNEGPFDLLCNHIPVFLVRDAIRFPDSIRAFQPSPVNNLADPERFWGFVASAPEATNFVAWLYSDLGTIKSLRKIRTYSVNTYVWRNAQGVRKYVKYHWIPVAGEAYIDRFEAVKLAGENPDVCGQDLFNTIASGTPVEYDLKVQLMDPAEGEFLSFDPLDCTKVWDEERYPLQPVGRMSLNRNPDNYAEQIEKVAFSPGNLMQGVEFSDDKMLQGRSTVYWDAQRYRLGPDFRKIPINKEAGFRPSDLTDSGEGVHVAGPEVRAELPKPDNFSQAGERYRSLSPEQQEHLVDNIAAELPLVSKATQATVLGYFQQADGEFAQRVRQQMTKYEK